MIESKDRPERLAVCDCGFPLVSTFTWDGYEFYCVNCGSKYGMIDAERENGPDDMMIAAHEEAEEKFNELRPHLLYNSGRRTRGCAKCDAGEQHRDHLTDEEKAGAEKAYADLKKLYRTIKFEESGDSV